ncbi:nitric oxide-associated protein 1 [Hetaerina americana]|uniref:nitric oxide-associated protein 1 n=1 Tax=Hetaerina americana TaxID=62018 RepID=UPI003A7F2067
MIVLRCLASCKCVRYFYGRDVCRRCSNTVTSNANDSELLLKLDDSNILDGSARLENLKTKIIYSSTLHRSHLLSWKETKKLMRKQSVAARMERFKRLREHSFPIAMKYMEELNIGNIDDNATFGVTIHHTVDGNAELLDSCDDVKESEANGISEVKSTVPTRLSTSHSLDTQDKQNLVIRGQGQRNISCGGCGAGIQCEDMYNPGFIPLEFLSSVNSSQKNLILCQRCYFTRSLKVSLQVNYNPYSYLKDLNKLKSRKSLILGVIDVTDISRSICSSISEFVGKGHPIILVGTKVDLLPPDSNGYLNRVREHIKEIFKSNGHLNVKELFLVSSASGIGIESLITKLFSIWKNYGDVFIVGHTNVGKSSLFNALLNSDLCKAIGASDIQSATTSPWPGTTLGILKFPITRPAGMFMFHRTQRLQLENLQKKNAKKERPTRKQYKGYLASPDTFSVSDLEDINCEMGTTAVNCTVMKLSKEKLLQLGVSPSKLRDKDIRWCHDTPGIPHTERTLDLLTPEEMKYALPGPKMIIPRTFYMKVGLTLFIGGLARLDYNSGDLPICMTVFASSKLPILVCSTANAEELYTSLLGTKLFGVPKGGQGRLKHWPPLASKDYDVVGIGWKESSADVLLSSAGWVAITAGRGVACSLRAHTPRGFGVDLRTPSLLPHSVVQKGPRRRETPAYPSLKDHLFTKYSP